ncbi:MAG: hypothetical protein KJ709_07710, partial [Nanoarchaeota archaeon]|nr:hypothetical protein [Nanoarchaeota archaeon]
FGSGTLAYLLTRKDKNSALYVLFSSFKNGGAATAIIFVLFGIRATIPMAISAFMVPFFILYLQWIYK